MADRIIEVLSVEIRINPIKPVLVSYHDINSFVGGLDGGKVTEPWLSADDIASHLGVTKDTIYTWIAEKAMPAHKIGRLWKFQATEVDDWVRSGGASAEEARG